MENMENAFTNVLASSKEIIKKNQRHLFCSMFDLLTNTIKSMKTSNADISSDELAQFCWQDAAVLLFDKDAAIQNCAVSMLEELVKCINWQTFHASYNTTAIKEKLLHVFVPKIQDLRENDNRNWHKIWCLFIQVLEVDLLRGANTLNAFLSIVESAFRSGNQLIFAESFLCWRLLIQIFHQNDELHFPPRLKLICVPFKPNQLKSSYSAGVKLKVWWFFINCMGTHLQERFEEVLQPFLLYICNVLQRYESKTEMCVLCLATLLSKSSTEVLEHFQTGFKLDIMRISFSLSDEQLLKQHWRVISNTVIVAMNVLALSKPNLSQNENVLLHLLLEPIFKAILNVMVAPLFICMCNELQTVLPKYPRLAVAFLNTIASENTQMKHFDDEKVHSDCLFALTSFLISISSTTTKSVFKNCILQVYNLRNSFISEHDVWQTMQVILDCLALNRDLEESKVLIWRRVSFVIMERVHKSRFEIPSEKLLLHRWIYWPLRVYADIEETNNISDATYDTSFFSVWEQLLKLNDLQCGSKDVLTDIKCSLQKLIATRSNDMFLVNFYEIYAETIMSLKITQNCKEYKELLELINDSLRSTALEKKSKKAFLTVFKNIIGKLNGLELKQLYEQIKNVLETAKRTAGIELTFFRHLKNMFAQNFQNESFSNLALVLETFCTDHINGANTNILSQEIYRPNIEPPTTPPKTMPIRRDSLSEIIKKKCVPRDNQMLFRPRLRTLDDSGKLEKSATYSKVKFMSRNAVFLNKAVGDRKLQLRMQKPDETIDLTIDNTESQTTNISTSSPPKRTAVQFDCASPSTSNAGNGNAVASVTRRGTPLIGRGAQLINMIRNRQINTPQQQQPQQEATADVNSTAADVVRNVMSPTVPAVPSPSILKRKTRDLAEPETPLSKRKRVSFHDPPVSTTKEYIVDSETDNRSVAIEETARMPAASPSGNISNIAAAAHNKDNTAMDFVIKSPLKNLLRSRTASLDVNPFVVLNSPNKTNVTETDDQIFERVLERYASGNQQTSNNLIYKFAKIVSNAMRDDNKIKSNIMELLCEAHSKEFLEHAIQENLCSIVLERLNLNSVLDFVGCKAKTDASFRNDLLATFPQILRQNEAESFSLDFIKKIFQCGKYTDNAYFDFISFLIKLRNDNQLVVSPAEMELADSSSNL